MEGVWQLWKKQEKRCAICKKLIKKKDIQVDHDHKTGKVRGLLCLTCNMGIGYLKESIDNLLSAIKYLERNT